MYQNKWPNALDDNPEVKHLLRQYRLDLEEEIHGILDYTKKIDSKEKSVINRINQIENALLLMLKRIASHEEAQQLMDSLIDLQAAQVNINHRKLKALETNNRFSLQLETRFFNENTAKILAIKKRLDQGIIVPEQNQIVYLISEIKKLFKLYVAFFSFIQFSITQIDTRFKQESVKLEHYKKSEREFIDRAENKLSIERLRLMKEAYQHKKQILEDTDKSVSSFFNHEREEYIRFYKDLASLLVGLKKIRDLFEAKLNTMDAVFEHLNNEVDKLKDAEKTSKWFDHNVNTGAIIGAYKKSNEREIQLEQIAFLRKVYMILRDEKSLLSKNEQRIMHMLNNAYYHLVKQRRFVA
ncbi:MAG: hypothetical protein Q8O89_04465 [Nanoarchaeota archaeon]|nr:hypothetical protein [Nanoarchaeota archaeon]